MSCQARTPYHRRLEGAGTACYVVLRRMRVHLRPQRRTVEVQGRRRVAQLLAELGIVPGTAMVIRGDMLLTETELVEDGDEVEVRAVISGGAR